MTDYRLQAMNYFSSEQFNGILFFMGFLVIYGIVVYLARGRIIKYVLAQPDDKKLRMSQGLPKLLRLFKFVLWISPLFLVSSLLHLFAENYNSFFYSVSSLVVVFIGFLEAFLFFKMLLNAIDKS